MSELSQSLWRMAWRRLLRDRVAVVCMAILAVYLVVVAVAALGLVVADWGREAGVNYAPPGLLGKVELAAQEPLTTAAKDAKAATPSNVENVVDPLADVIASLKKEIGRAHV